jgi:phosphonate transport system substrate-binding protein
MDKRTGFALVALTVVIAAAVGIRHMESETDVIRVVFTPGPGIELAEMEEKYGPLMDYMGEQVGIPFEIVVASSYAAAIEDLRHTAHVARTAPANYVLSAGEVEVELLGREIVDGQDHYQGVIIAQPGMFCDLSEIAGHTMAFVDPGSTSGCVAALVMLAGAGVTLDDLGEYAFLGGHPAVIEAVVNGAVDVGATCDRRLDVAIGEGVAEEGVNYVALAWSPPIVYNPWIVRADLPAELKARIREALQSAPPGVLAPSGTDAVVPAADADYDFIRDIVAEAEKLQ